MKITCIDKDVKTVLQSGFYRIPRFQRPYLWEKEQVEDFWNDTIASTESEYFIGSMVVFGPIDHAFGVVDGQQRLTTITLLLAALRNAFAQESRQDLAKGVHQFVERMDLNYKPQFVLQSETSYPYFQEKIQKDGPSDAEDIEPGVEELRLQNAFDSITALISNSVNAIKDDPSIPAKKKPLLAVDKLVQIRDKVLNLKLIFVELDDEDDAYLIFETLNTRGKDLSVSDLVKNHLTRNIKPTNKHVDRAVDRWNKIVEVLEGSEEDLRLNSFLHHLWLSEYDYTTEKKLFKAIRSVVKKDNADHFLKKLTAEVETYREIQETSYRKWQKQEVGIKGSLDALGMFRVKQQLPMIMAVMRNYRSGDLKKKHVEDILKTIESFHFMFTAVTSQRSSGGISFMYALHARDLLKASTLPAKLKCLATLKEKLKARLPKLQEFEANFLEISYTSEFTKQKRLVQYILSKVDAHSASGVQLDYDRMTIEHLAAQNPTGSSSVAKKMVGKLGNLILLDGPTNEKLGNKDFVSKVKLLQGTQVFLDKQLKNAAKWEDAEIMVRTKTLARLAYNNIWKI